MRGQLIDPDDESGPGERPFTIAGELDVDALTGRDQRPDRPARPSRPAQPSRSKRPERPTRHARRRRFRLIDYPRRGRTGIRHWLPSWRLILGTMVVFVGLVVGGFFIALHNVVIPQPNDFATAQATIFDYADGRTQIAHVGVNRISVPLSQIPPDVQHALLAAEDRDFYHEASVSPTGILRAAKNDLTSSGNLQGGSTITQQYVKNYYLTQKQTFSRKLDEVLVSIKIDGQLSKDEILQNYLNTIYFARGAYGIETAARAYFNESVTQLANDPAKAAYLASLVQQPYYFGTAPTDPNAQKALQARWNYVLDGMVSEGWLTKSTRDRMRFPTPIPYQPNDLAGMNGYMVNAATQYLDKLHDQNPAVPDSNMIARGGYTVVTTFQPDYMQGAQQAVQANLSTLNAGNPGDANVHVGLAAVDDTGAVLGFYGGPDYLRQGFDDALQAAGPTGSDVSTALANGVSPNPRHDWPAAITALGQVGIADANPKDVPPSDDDFSATPVNAAAANAVGYDNGVYHAPFEVSEVLYQGQVIWQSATSTATFDSSPSVGRSPFSYGIDGSSQWAWTVSDFGDISVAVDMYATKPNGVTNRVLTGMTAMPNSSAQVGTRAPSVPVSRTISITFGFAEKTVFPAMKKGAGLTTKPGGFAPVGQPSPTTAMADGH